MKIFGSILDPDKTAMSVLFFTSVFLFKIAASATAPPGYRISPKLW